MRQHLPCLIPCLSLLALGGCIVPGQVLSKSDGGAGTSRPTCCAPLPDGPGVPTEEPFCCADGVWVANPGDGDASLCDAHGGTGSVCGPDAICCARANEPPGIEGAHCCADGTWAPDIGDGSPAVCDPHGGEGVICDSDPCCDRADEPPGIEGAHCCADGTWAGDTGSGDSSVCNPRGGDGRICGEVVWQGAGVCDALSAANVGDACLGDITCDVACSCSDVSLRCTTADGATYGRITQDGSCPASCGSCCDPATRPAGIEPPHCCADGTWVSDTGAGDTSLCDPHGGLGTVCGDEPCEGRDYCDCTGECAPQLDLSSGCVCECDEPFNCDGQVCDCDCGGASYLGCAPRDTCSASASSVTCGPGCHAVLGANGCAACECESDCTDYVVPPTNNTTECRRDDDCTLGSCVAPGESVLSIGFCPTECTTDPECGSGNVCVELHGGSCTRCEPACTSTSCGPWRTCGADGHCGPAACSAGDYTCPPGGACSGGSGADVHGCVLDACTSDAECGCGACVNGFCRSGPGRCQDAVP